MTRRGSGTVIVLLKKRTIVLICGAIFLAGAVVFGLLAQRDKQSISHETIAADTILVLDAGHGGEDGGAVSASGVPESRINLQIVQKLEGIFTFTGQNITLTRSGEGAIYSPDAQTLREKKVSDLHNRVKIVNETQRSFLISIHQNSLPSTKVKGAQTFYNAIDPAQKTAISVQQALNGAINQGKVKNAKQIEDSIFLMKNINSPGILVECGFMSNPTEVKQLQTDDHQLRISAAIVSGFLQSKTERDRP